MTENTRRFTKRQLIDLGVANQKVCVADDTPYYRPWDDWREEDEGPAKVLADEHVSMDKFEEVRQRVFIAPDDGKLWSIQYEYGDGSGVSEMNPPDMCAWYKGVEVESRERVIVEYRPVQVEASS